MLLPHCDLMVFHGGTNSLLAALDVGLPMVIIPLIEALRGEMHALPPQDRAVHLVRSLAQEGQV